LSGGSRNKIPLVGNTGGAFLCVTRDQPPGASWTRSGTFNVNKNLRVGGIAVGGILAIVAAIMLVGKFFNPMVAPPIPRAAMNTPPPRESLHIEKSVPSPGDLGGGINFPLGETIQAFLQDHPDARCSEGIGEQMCGISNPLPSDCPSPLPCNYAMYRFKKEVLVGFLASYLKDDWNALYKIIAIKYGAPRIHDTAITDSLPIGDRISEWKVPGGYLTCMMFFGDLDDGPIKVPFAIGFGPEPMPH
jgi:hypothetical protein